MSSSGWTVKAISEPKVAKRGLPIDSLSAPPLAIVPPKGKKTHLPSVFDPLGRLEAFLSFSCVSLSSWIRGGFYRRNV